MKVRGLELPKALQTLLLNGMWRSRGDDYSGKWHNDYDIKLFKKVFPRADDDLLPDLFSYEYMLRVNEFWDEPKNLVKLYLGKASKNYPPGNVDPNLTVIIGDSEYESPIALDYRSSTPRVVYFCDVEYKILWYKTSLYRTLWVEAAKDIETLLSALELNSK